MKKTLGTMVILFFILIIIIPTEGIFAGNGDITGHWAEEKIERRVREGAVSGYGDGTFKPDTYITKAEFKAYLHGFFGTCETTFERDIHAEDGAKKQGMGDRESDSRVSRLEAAELLYNTLRKKPETPAALNRFKDMEASSIKDMEALNTVVAEGYLTGYPDGTLHPKGYMTRAEAVVMLDTAAGQFYNKPGEYGPKDGMEVIDGNLTINSPGVTLNNIKIEGDMYLTAGQGSEGIYLHNVTVLGRTLVCGEVKSLSLDNSALGKTIVDAKNKMLEISAFDTTTIGEITLNSEVRLRTQGLHGIGIGNTVIDFKQEESLSAVLLGNFGNIYVNTKNARVKLSGGRTDRVNFNAAATGSNMEVSEAYIENIEINTKTKIIVSKAHVQNLYLEDKAAGTLVEVKQNSTVDNLFEYNPSSEIVNHGRINKVLFPE